MAAELTEAQRSLLGWIERRDDGGRGVRFLPQTGVSAAALKVLIQAKFVEVGRNRETGSDGAWRVTPAGRAALKED